jgi:tetratricopeptide (TPR) repeat protein
MLACGGCLSLAAAPVLAQDVAPASPASASVMLDKARVREARQHFSAASEHYRAGRFREALRGFELAERLVPSPELSFNIARAHEQLGEIEAAIEHYERYVAARGEASDVGSVSARIAALRGSLEQRPVRAMETAALRIDAEPGAEIKLDGTLLGVAPIDRIVWVEPGTHVLEAELSGHAPYRGEIDAPAGSMVAGSVELVQHSSVPDRGERAAPRGAPAASSGASLPVWIAGGACIASAAVGGAARISAESSRSGGDLDAANSADGVAGIALASALTSGVLAAVLYFAAPAHVESRQAL